MKRRPERTSKQKLGIREPEHGVGADKKNPPAESTIGPLGGDAGTSAYGESDIDMDSGKSAMVELARQKYPSLRAVPTSELAGLLAIVGDFHPPHVTPTRKARSFGLGDEALLRTLIQKLASKVDSALLEENGYTNAVIKRRFKKSREQMGFEELAKVLEWMEEYYADAI